MLKVSPKEKTEVRMIASSLLPYRSVISRDAISDIVDLAPEMYPVLASLPIKRRITIITAAMNEMFFLRNQTAQRPKARVWDLTSPKKAGVCFVSC